MKKILLILTLILAGCSNQPEAVSKTYLLPLSEQAAVANIGTHQPLLVIRPIEMADHLASTSLVYQISDTEIVQAQQNLWAESISKQLTQRISDDLRRKQLGYWPISASSATDLPRLQIKFTQFNGHYSGIAIISGEYLLFDGKGELQDVFLFEFKVPLNQDGYDSQVRALAKGVSHLTSQIAQKLAVRSTNTTAETESFG